MNLLLRYRLWRMRRRWADYWANEALVMWASKLNVGRREYEQAALQG